MHSVRLVALSLLAAGCSGNVSADRTAGGGVRDASADADANFFGPIDERSGARIQVVDWFSGSVPVARKELFDAETTVSCEIARAEDGVFRCLPVSEGGPVVFLDDQCTQPVIATDLMLPPTCSRSSSSYVTYPMFASCPEPRWRVVVRGGVIEAPPQLYLDRGEHECSKGSASGPLYEALPAAPADFAAFERQVLEETPSLGVEAWQGEDGARVRGTLRYLPEDVECGAVPDDRSQLPYPTSPLASPSRCTPAHPARLGFWTTSPECSLEQAVVATGRCDPRPFSIEEGLALLDDGGVDFGPRFRRPGPPVTSGVWLYLLGSCIPVDGIVPHLVFHEPGPVVPLTDFPRLDLVRSTPGPVERLGWVAREGGTALPTGRIGWSDPAAGSGRECSPVTFAEGTVLCVPPNTGFGEWTAFPLPPDVHPDVHTDPTCSPGSVVDAFAVEALGSRPAPEVGQWIVAETPGPCMSDGVTTRQVTARHPGVVYGRVLGACVELTPDAWWVPDLGPARPARDVLPPLAARPL